MAPQDRWILDVLSEQSIPTGYEAPTATDLLVLDDPGNGVARAAWVSDSKRMCIASLGPDATGARAANLICLETPKLGPLDPPDMFGPVPLDVWVDGPYNGEDWFAVVVGSTEPLVLYDGPALVVDPLHQRTVRSADGVVFSFVTFHAMDDAIGSIPSDRGREAQLCTRSKSVCEPAMPITYPSASPSPFV